MWINQSFILAVRVKLPRFLNIWLTMYLGAIHQWLLALEGLAALHFGPHAGKIQAGVDAMHAMVLSLMETEPQNYVRVKLKSKKDGQIRVRVDTWGWSFGRKKV